MPVVNVDRLVPVPVATADGLASTSADVSSPSTSNTAQFAATAPTDVNANDVSPPEVVFA